MPTAGALHVQVDHAEMLRNFERASPPAGFESVRGDFRL